MNPLKNVQILTEQDIETVFSNVQSIYEVNKEFQNNLTKEFHSSQSIQKMNIGKVFLERVSWIFFLKKMLTFLILKKKNKKQD